MFISFRYGTVTRITQLLGILALHSFTFHALAPNWPARYSKSPCQLRICINPNQATTRVQDNLRLQTEWFLGAKCC